MESKGVLGPAIETNAFISDLSHAMKGMRDEPSLCPTSIIQFVSTSSLVLTKSIALSTGNQSLWNVIVPSCAGEYVYSILSYLRTAKPESTKASASCL